MREIRTYMQQKYLDNTVGKPLIQQFSGALDGIKATKGVFSQPAHTVKQQEPTWKVQVKR